MDNPSADRQPVEHLSPKVAPARQTAGRLRGVTIGNFDGVHRGHKRLVEQTLALCRKHGLDCAAMTFWPHPRALFSGRHMAPLAEMSVRARLLKHLGVQSVLEVPFTRELAALGLEEFYEAHLAPLNMRLLVVGYDFRLGKDRAGDFEALKALGERRGFLVHRVSPLLYRQKPVSSTRIREAIENGDMQMAAEMLGRPHAIEGEVEHGDKRGKALGFPTANLRLPDVLLPPDGVYATRLLFDGRFRPAVTNVGFNPTFDGQRRTCESFLIDCGEVDLYERHVRVEFLRRLRGEVRFASPAELVAQIGRDVDEGRQANAEFRIRSVNRSANTAMNTAGARPQQG